VLPAPEIADAPVWIDTDDAGFIVDWHPDALTLVGCEAARAPHVMLPIMFTIGGPPRGQIQLARRGQILELAGVLRPQGRSSLPVRYRIERSPTGYVSRPVVRWTFTKADAASL
jgi:hypothetical protein